MDYVDFTTNEDRFDNSLQTTIIGLQALEVYELDIEFKTIIDEAWSGNEQRRAQWSNPRRTWTLKFQKTPKNGKKFREFFIKMRGQYHAFYFKWSSYNSYGEFTGGDDNWYLVRFNSDKLNEEVDYLGYQTFSIGLIEVRTEGKTE